MAKYHLREPFLGGGIGGYVEEEEVEVETNP